MTQTSAQWESTAALAEAKYRYVVSCQIYGKMAGPDSNAADKEKAIAIAQLARDYDGLRIAYVEEDKQTGTFYSVLVK